MSTGWLAALRRNHALEHATVTMLSARMKPGARVLGRSTARGFHIYADVPTEVVSQAAADGLASLKNGNRSLAVSPFCGTNLVTAAILAGTASVLISRARGRSPSLPTTILTTLAAIIAAQPLGMHAQQHLTTSADVSRVEIDEVSSVRKGRYVRHYIRTLQG